MSRVSWVSEPAVGDYPPGATFGPRTLGDFELVWLLSGSATWTYDGTAPHQLRPGTVVVARPGMCDEYRWDENRPSRHGYAHFTLDPMPSGADFPAWPVVRHLAAPDPVTPLLGYLLWLATDGRGSDASSSGRVGDRTAEVVDLVLSLLVEGPLPVEVDDPEPPAIARALDHVRRAWERRVRPVPLAELAAAAAVSKAHLARQFHDRFGIGAVAALDVVRLSRAESMLARTNLSVAGIGRACGYDDPLHFSRRFRAVYGVSPRAYRSGPAVTSPVTTLGLTHLATRLLGDGSA